MSKLGICYKATILSSINLVIFILQCFDLCMNGTKRFNTHDIQK